MPLQGSFTAATKFVRSLQLTFVIFNFIIKETLRNITLIEYIPATEWKIQSKNMVCLAMRSRPFSEFCARQIFFVFRIHHMNSFLKITQKNAKQKSNLLASGKINIDDHSASKFAAIVFQAWRHVFFVSSTG